MGSTSMQPLLTIREMAERLGVHPDTLKRLEKSGKIPKPRRIAKGQLEWRVYSNEDVTRLKKILLELGYCAEEGFSVKLHAGGNIKGEVERVVNKHSKEHPGFRIVGMVWELALGRRQELKKLELNELYEEKE